jgi:hypothetical protein
MADAMSARAVFKDSVGFPLASVRFIVTVEMKCFYPRRADYEKEGSNIEFRNSVRCRDCDRDFSNAS